MRLSIRRLTGAAIGVLLSLGAACTEEDATPIEIDSQTGAVDTSNTVDTGNSESESLTPHRLQTSDQMQELAEQQCLDDPNKDQGVVRAVDPVDNETVLAEVEVDCAEVRPG